MNTLRRALRGWVGRIGAFTSRQFGTTTNEDLVQTAGVLRVRRDLVAALATSLLLPACKDTTIRKPAMYEPPITTGTKLDPKSAYGRYWPGQPALFKVRDQLILAIPPMYQQFWVQKDKVVRAPAPKEKIPQVAAIGFNFFMPDFSGFTPQNYENEFDPNRIDVVSIEPADSGAVGGIDGSLKRLSGVGLNPEKFKDEFGLRCFDNDWPADDPRVAVERETKYCVGRRTDDESMLMWITVPP